MSMPDHPNMHTTWRFIVHRPAPGAWNMAVDEAMAMAAAAGEVPPTLRFYAWAPPCISLGRHQSLNDVHRERCRALGVDIVRRPTGGRAILHTDELTYCITASPSETLVSGAVMDAYHRISGGLVQGLRLLGLPAEEAPGTNRAGPDVSAACFEVPSAYEITAKGRKLMGSAQSRRVDWVLQHGSLPLYGDVTRVVDYLALPSEEERSKLRSTLRAHATTVEELLGYRVEYDQAVEYMARGFALATQVTLLPGELTRGEIATTERLMAGKYGHEAWTARHQSAIAQRAG